MLVYNIRYRPLECGGFLPDVPLTLHAIILCSIIISLMVMHHYMYQSIQ